METHGNKPAEDDHNGVLISYYQLRMFIGLLGFLLSFLLFATTYFLNDEHPLKVSISHYYYSFGHIIFVGTLCVLGGLFATYRGKDKYENRLSNFAGVMAVLVAIFPTEIKGYEGNIYIPIGSENYKEWFSCVHYASAGLLFVSFAVFCLYFFQKSDKKQDGKPVSEKEALKKSRRNRYYKICGWGILISIACIGLIALFKNNLSSHNPFLMYSTFIFETTSLFFFSTSWLLKSSEFWNKNIPLVTYFR
ncbi:hypothetical protein [Chryseobacterium viscerum]|uniref:DUF998 domain-containing protein n=1 Tax=Chryseobacterium viscerum TaxID=1037377 RepID=A0A316WTQ4_9FLAO|nr:hypothetical protein [Chryseobacterium viscerum]PWN61920.1 hypothetical protein C1634_011715 [Chryseobacterium viscerum]